MMPAIPASRSRRMPSRSVDAAGDEDVDVRPAGDRAELGQVRRPAAVGEDEPRDATIRRAPRRAASRVGGPARRQGKAASRSGRGSSPTASQSPATARHVREARRVVDDRHRGHDPGRAGREGQADRVGGVDAAGDLERDGDPRRDRADRLEVRRPAAPRAVEVDEVDEPGAARDELLGDPLRPIGRRTDARSRRRASRRSASVRRSRSIDGMTCTG